MKRVGVLLGAMLITVCLWATVNLSKDFEIPLRVETNVTFPDGKTSAALVPSRLTVSVKASGWQLARMLYNHPPVCVIDLRDAEHAGGTIIFHQRDLLEHIALPPDAHVVSMQPDSIAVILDNLTEKTVPIIPDVTLEFVNGFERVGAVHAQPESVQVSGARTIIEKIHDWRTKYTSLHHVVLPINQDVPLSDTLRDIVTLSRSSVTITADVQQIADKKFEEVPINILHAPPDTHIDLKPPTLTVWLRGGAETLARLTPQDIQATMDYYTLAATNPDSAEIEVSAPGGTKVIQEIPNAAQWFVMVSQ
jgi:YbbR domain-containing protein